MTNAREEIIVENALSQKGPLLKILVVDDNVESAKTLGWMIEALGYEPQVCYGAVDALEKAQVFLPHVVLMDIGMPGMNGYELCQTLKQSPDFKRTVFIAQTGWDKKDNQDISKEAGFDHYLVKPVDMKVLEELLTKATAGFDD